MFDAIKQTKDKKTFGAYLFLVEDDTCYQSDIIVNDKNEVIEIKLDALINRHVFTITWNKTKKVYDKYGVQEEKNLGTLDITPFPPPLTT